MDLKKAEEGEVEPPAIFRGFLWLFTLTYALLFIPAFCFAAVLLVDAPRFILFPC